jgi:two-component sensor histidine kinase
MNSEQVNRVNTLYQLHLNLLKLQGKSQKTIDAYSLGLRLEEALSPQGGNIDAGRKGGSCPPGKRP